MNLKKKTTKVISLIVSLALILPSSSSGFPISPNVLNIPAAVPVDLTIPSEAGRIVEFYAARAKGKSAPTVIFIQDAHTNYDAQKNIARIVDQIIRSRLTDFVAVEGTEGPIDTTLFRTFPIVEIKEKVFDRSMRRGETTGPEYLSITGNQPFELFGVDDQELYLRNIDLLMRISGHRRDGLHFVKGMRQAVHNLKSVLYSPESKEWDKAVRAFRVNEKNLFGFVDVLERTVSKINLDLKNWPHFSALLGFKNDTESSTELPEDIRAEELMDETNSLALEVEIRLARTDEEKSLIKLSGYMDLLERGLELTLVRQDVASLKKLAKEFPQEKILKFLSEKLARENLQNNLRIPKGISLVLLSGEILEFYETAARRDEAFVNSLLKEMKRKRKAAAVLITGGFHREGIIKKLQRKGISYYVVAPAIAKISEHTHYLSLMESYGSFLSQNASLPLTPTLSPSRGEGRVRGGDTVGLGSPYAVTPSVPGAADTSIFTHAKQLAAEIEAARLDPTEVVREWNGQFGIAVRPYGPKTAFTLTLPQGRAALKRAGRNPDDLAREVLNEGLVIPFPHGLKPSSAAKYIAGEKTVKPKVTEKTVPSSSRIIPLHPELRAKAGFGSQQRYRRPAKGEGILVGALVALFGVVLAIAITDRVHLDNQFRQTTGYFMAKTPPPTDQEVINFIHTSSPNTEGVINTLTTILTNEKFPLEARVRSAQILGSLLYDKKEDQNKAISALKKATEPNQPASLRTAAEESLKKITGSAGFGAGRRYPERIASLLSKVSRVALSGWLALTASLAMVTNAKAQGMEMRRIVARAPKGVDVEPATVGPHPTAKPRMIVVEDGASLQDAIDAASPGQILFLRSGFYYRSPSEDSLRLKAGVSIVGEDKYATFVISGIFEIENGAAIEHVTISGYEHSPVMMGNAMTIRDVIFDGLSKDVLDAVQIIGDDNRILESTVAIAPLHLEGNRNYLFQVLVHSRVSRQFGRGLFVQGRGNRFDHGTVVSRAPGNVIAVSVIGPFNSITNSIVVASSDAASASGIQALDSLGSEITYSIVLAEGATKSKSIDIGGKIEIGEGVLLGLNPLFVDEANGDFHLAPDSPAIGAASDGSDLGAFPSGFGVEEVASSQEQVTKEIVTHEPSAAARKIVSPLTSDKTAAGFGAGEKEVASSKGQVARRDLPLTIDQFEEILLERTENVMVDGILSYGLRGRYHDLSFTFHSENSSEVSEDPSFISMIVTLEWRQRRGELVQETFNYDGEKYTASRYVGVGDYENPDKKEIADVISHVKGFSTLLRGRFPQYERIKNVAIEHDKESASLKLVFWFRKSSTPSKPTVLTHDEFARFLAYDLEIPDEHGEILHYGLTRKYGGTNVSFTFSTPENPSNITMEITSERSDMENIRAREHDLRGFSLLFREEFPYYAQKGGIQDRNVGNLNASKIEFVRKPSVNVETGFGAGEKEVASSKGQVARKQGQVALRRLLQDGLMRSFDGREAFLVIANPVLVFGNLARKWRKSGFDDGNIYLKLGKIAFHRSQLYLNILQSLAEHAELAAEVFENNSPLALSGIFGSWLAPNFRHGGMLSGIGRGVNSFFKQLEMHIPQYVAARTYTGPQPAGFGAELSGQKAADEIRIKINIITQFLTEKTYGSSVEALRKHMDQLDILVASQDWKAAYEFARSVIGSVYFTRPGKDVSYAVAKDYGKVQEELAYLASIAAGFGFKGEVPDVAKVVAAEEARRKARYEMGLRNLMVLDALVEVLTETLSELESLAAGKREVIQTVARILRLTGDTDLAVAKVAERQTELIASGNKLAQAGNFRIAVINGWEGLSLFENGLEHLTAEQNSLITGRLDYVAVFLKGATPDQAGKITERLAKLINRRNVRIMVNPDAKTIRELTGISFAQLVGQVDDFLIERVGPLILSDIQGRHELENVLSRFYALEQAKLMIQTAA